MDRREFLKGAGTAAALSMMPGILQARKSSKRPNIVMIFSDDATTLDFGCYGNKAIRTPNIDQLAAEGMRFNNMFTATPMCSPSKMMMYTGLYPHRNGAHPNHSEVKPGTRSLPHYLQSLGYRVVLFGKRHFKPPECFPFELPSGDVQSRDPLGELEKVLANPGDKPLCVLFCWYHAHFPWSQNNHNYDPDKVEFHPYLIDTPEARQMRANYYSSITNIDNGVGQVRQRLEKYGFSDNTLLMWTVDHGTYWLHERQNAYDAALNVPFIARWPGHIPEGTVSDALASFVDIVPTMIDVAGGDVDEVVKRCGGEPLDGKSLVGVLEGKEKEHHPAVYGYISWGVREAYPMRTVRTKTHKYIWNIDSHFRYPTVWGLNMGGDFWPVHDPYTRLMAPVWKSYEEKAKSDPHAAARIQAELYRPPEELYDIRKDPHEMNNLADDPAQKKVLESMRDLLKQWMRQQGDKGDSAYHQEEGKPNKFLDKVYCRQKIVNIKLEPINLAAALTERVRVELTSPLWRSRIYYTLDGSEPTTASNLYTRPFVLDSPTTVKARAYDKDIVTAVNTVEYDGSGFEYIYDHLLVDPKHWP